MNEIIKKGREVVRLEVEAVRLLENRIDDHFKQAVELLLSCRGRVIVTGLGKSGIIANKIASTLTSTGTAAFFLHAAEGLHGDLGAVLRDDVVICISKSGNTVEILRLMPLFKRQGVSIIAITGNSKSEMAKRSDVVLDVSVKEEACPFDFIPTSSTTATLVMGDALALTLFQERGFSIEDFAQYHPGGEIGKRLFLRVDDVMHKGDGLPVTGMDTPMTETILEITSKRLGAICILDETGYLAGIITDGDLRRYIEQKQDIWALKAKDLMTSDPKCIQAGDLATKALHIMEAHSVNQLIVLDTDKKPVGMVHIQDLVRADIY